MGSRSLGKEVLQRTIARNFDRSRREASSIGAVAALCAALGLLAAPQADAANTYFVTNTGDSGTGTLRKAIADASAAGSGNTVMFDASLVGSTITLTSYITIDKPMYIYGPGSKLLTISGGHHTRIFYVKTDAYQKATDAVVLRDLTLTAGNAYAFYGGAIATKNSILRLENSVVADSTAAVGGGISAANSFLLVNNSRISGNTAGSTGGGISAAFSSVSTRLSTISGNTAGTYGGGIYARNIDTPHYFSVISSTISGNRIPQPAGFAFTGGGGIALKTTSGETDGLYSSTVAMNYAFQNGGGIALLDSFSAGVFTIRYSTIASNSSKASSGNGISAASPGTVETTRTIVSGNFSTNGLSDLVGTFHLTECLVQQPDGATITPTSASNLFGADPHLSPLADHGGPTLTLLPSAASAVVDVLDCDPGTTADQRAIYLRCINGKSDIGAVERQNPEDIIFRNGLEPI